MQPLSLLVLFVAGWALTNFWLVPLLHSSWATSDVLGKVNRTVTLTVLEKARDLCGVGAITMGILTVAIGAIAVLGEGSAVWTKSMMEVLSASYRAIESFAQGYAQFVVWFGVMAGALALYVCSKNAKRRVVEAWQADAERLRAQLQDDPAAWGSLREEPKYRSRIERMDQLGVVLATESSSQEQRAGAALETARLLNELAAEESRSTLDLERVLAGDHIPERPKSKLMLLFGVIAGPRLSRDLGLVGRYLSLLVMALLLATLVGWTAAPLANSLRVTVNELRVAALTDEVDREIEEAIANVAPPEDPPRVEPTPPGSVNQATAIARATRLVAQAAVHQIQSSGLLDPARGANASASRAEFVRNAILNRPLDDGDSVAANLRRNVAEGFANVGRSPVAGDRLAEHLNGSVRDLVGRVHERNPKAVDRIVDRVMHRYHTSLNPLDVQGSLITRLVSASFGLADANANDELARVATNLASDVGKSAVSEWANLHARAIVADGLVGADAKAAVIQHLEGGDLLERSHRNSTLVRDLRLAKGQGWGPSAAERASETASNKVAAAVADHYRAADQRVVRRRLEGYASAFPRVVEAAGHAVQVSSATDFVKAMRSPHVRGVIFGRQVRPEFRVSDLAWEIDTATRAPTLLTLHPVVDDRQESLGPFAAGVVNQALRFAADQRVVATTITPGDGKFVSRITDLHPVLENTPLGCRVVEIDRVIDTFTVAHPDDGDEHQFGAQLADVSSQRVAAMRFLRVSHSAEVAAFAGTQCQAQDLAFQEAQPTLTGAVATHASEARRLFDALREGEYSTALVDVALECGVQNSMPVAQCLCDNAAQIDLSRAYWFPEDHTSQVRERDVTDVHDFDALFRPAATSDHIELWLHTTFAIRQHGELVDEYLETTALDFPSGQLESLNSVLIPAGLADYAENKLDAPRYDDFIAPIEQFVVVQRFMRAALAGQFGDVFPIEKLVDLERATAEFVPSQPTIRWEATNGEKFMDILHESGNEAAAAAYIGWALDATARREESLPSCDAAAR